MPRDSFFRRWYGIGVILLIIMVAIGGLTRLTNSGLSMVDWKPLSGVIPPLSEADWQQEFSNYKKYPEYKIHNKTMTISGFKKSQYASSKHNIVLSGKHLIKSDIWFGSFIVPIGLFGLEQ